MPVIEVAGFLVQQQHVDELARAHALDVGEDVGDLLDDAGRSRRRRLRRRLMPGLHVALSLPASQTNMRPRPGLTKSVGFGAEEHQRLGVVPHARTAP
jgi:hypothetical protein